MIITKTKQVTLTAPVTFELEISDDPKYSLLYRRLDGQENVYKLNNIIFMDNQLLKANTTNGYRSFRTNRIKSLTPINN